MTALDSDRLDREVVGLIPAGGLATRIAPLPCSKELFPIGFRSDYDDREKRPKVVAHYLLEKMKSAGIRKVYIILRPGKWDIPSYFGDGSMLRLNMAYLIVGSSLGPPYTLDQAYPFVQNVLVAFGFPDIVFSAKDAYKRLLAHQAATGADVVLGLFPGPKPYEVDMVDVNYTGRIRSISIKPRQSRLQYTWVLAVWTPVFSRFMHRYLKSRKRRMVEHSELSVGHVFQAAIRSDLRFESVRFHDKRWIDIGRPNDLVKAVRTFH
jgi:glucose-1-phosphate thymidylyltransferase